ncbi:hypothetical protein PR003_g1030 [Phytophthora rubi]|uniref:DDE-1 domain-containing protein n=1 Tax=Phytophthora rubi TaxID=129364 RepID=A0A6A4FWV0_9STRA|nr:hypothetical protein PR002_g953 [Phytophthora rubi]KAE9051767.1 hypothetical protein PR001_g1120 [Phytophthora rubi]KAE9358917.1 hypothetical protein PR003_g1030 [Phytophthora rubi]
MIIFAGVGGDSVEEELQAHPIFRNGAYLTVQKKAYCDEVRMLQWIEEVWKPSVPGSRLLLLDSLKTHKMEWVRQNLEVSCYTEVEVIPLGITGVAQPMDVSIMREFKRIYRDLYVG